MSQEKCMAKMPLLKIIVIFCISICVFSCTSEIERKRDIANSMIDRIEQYRETNGQLPYQIINFGQDSILIVNKDSLSKRGIDTSCPVTSVIEINGEVFCYSKEDSLNYVLWFGRTLGEGVYYYSDTKEWVFSPR